jgi:hypothetical protein
MNVGATPTVNKELSDVVTEPSHPTLEKVLIRVTDEIVTQVMKQMNDCFDKTVPFYTELIVPKLPNIIWNCNGMDLDRSIHPRLVEKYFDVNHLNTTESGKYIVAEIHVIIRCVYVLVLERQEVCIPLLLKDITELVKEYPQFGQLNSLEQAYLLKFRNAMVLALIFVPARLNKRLLLNVCARLEGSGIEYITGSGQKPCVTRRCEIYQREGCVEPEKRPEPRKRKPLDDASKRTTITPSLKRVKAIKLTSEDIVAVSKPNPHANTKPKPLPKGEVAKLRPTIFPISNTLYDKESWKNPSSESDLLSKSLLANASHPSSLGYLKNFPTLQNQPTPYEGYYQATLSHSMPYSYQESTGHDHETSSVNNQSVTTSNYEQADSEHPDSTIHIKEESESADDEGGYYPATEEEEWNQFNSNNHTNNLMNGFKRPRGRPHKKRSLSDVGHLLSTKKEAAGFNSLLSVVEELIEDSTSNADTVMKEKLQQQEAASFLTDFAQGKSSRSVVYNENNKNNYQGNSEVNMKTTTSSSSSSSSNYPINGINSMTLMNSQASNNTTTSSNHSYSKQDPSLPPPMSPFQTYYLITPADYAKVIKADPTIQLFPFQFPTSLLHNSAANPVPIQSHIPPANYSHSSSPLHVFNHHSVSSHNNHNNNNHNNVKSNQLYNNNNNDSIDDKFFNTNIQTNDGNPLHN